MTAPRRGTRVAPALVPPVAIGLALAALAAIAGCAASPTTAPAPGGAAAPSRSDLVAALGRRAAALDGIHGAGVIELRWRDDDGAHFEQGDADLWIEPPRRTALRVDKFGDVLLWLGSDDERYWLFDLLDEPTTLTTAAHDVPLTAFGDAMIAVTPIDLVALLGLAPLPGTPSGPPPRWQADVPGWALDVAGTAGAAHRRLVLDPATFDPVRVELLDGDGVAVLVAHLAGFRPVPIQGVALADRPRMPETVTIVDADGRGEVKLVLRRFSGLDDAGRRLFDLDRLIRHLRPDRTVAPAAAAGSPAGDAGSPGPL